MSAFEEGLIWFNMFVVTAGFIVYSILRLDEWFGDPDQPD